MATVCGGHVYNSTVVVDGDYPCDCADNYDAVDIKSQIDALSQFVALGAGVIVGRCGARSHVAALTPSLLSHIGREWVVFPATNAVVELATGDDDEVQEYEYIKFSVSPTLGLVSPPTPFRIEHCEGFCNKRFRGWVGPKYTSTRCLCAAADGGEGFCRFALVVAQTQTQARVCTLVVVDTMGKVGPVWLTDQMDGFSTVHMNGRWVVCSVIGGGGWGIQENTVISLWNFDGLESGRVTGVMNMQMPWQVHRAAFDGEDSLVVSQARLCQEVITVDLKETLAQNRLAVRPLPVAAGAISEKYFISGIICWKGSTYAECGTELVCLATGRRTVLPPGIATMPIGGPYYSVQRTCVREECFAEVYSVGGEGKVCCRHRQVWHSERLYFGNELAVRDPFDYDQRRKHYMEVVDALSGFLGSDHDDTDDGDYPCDCAENYDAVDIKSQIDARSQFVALGAGVIVGRCGGARSHVAALTPSLLSHIGREWVVFPATNAVVELSNKGCELHYHYFGFSVSPTLGLVRPPAPLHLGVAGGYLSTTGTRFRGWVGPRTAARCCDDGGRRFALVVSLSWRGTQCLEVIDTTGRVGPVLVTDEIEVSGAFCMNRRWAACTMRGDGCEVGVWNFDKIESGSVTEAARVTLPWIAQLAAFSESDIIFSQGLLGPGAMVVDLQAILTIPFTAVCRPPYIESLMCWKRMVYAILLGGAELLCLTTGNSTRIPPEVAWPVGGPYSAVRSTASEECLIDVYSVVEPTKVCSRLSHRPGSETMNFGKQLIAVKSRTAAHDDGTQYIEVIDVMSGCVIFKMTNRGSPVTAIL
ncbi:hypothetical protein Pelo_1048 [Pelomyxa schiedti]|nr:hypothetical protein Pelo_1048 [Pelomyxa schiedti]